MKKITFSTAFLMIMSINILAKEIALIQNIDGYIRAGYQNTDIDGDRDYTDIALGGKLHIDTLSWNGISAGASFYTTHALFGKNEGNGVPFFDIENNAYSILGEAYLLTQWDNTMFKIGRQELDTPFADTDDIGMIPNTFEAAVVINKDIPDTTIFLAQLQKWAGVDSDNPSTFTKLNDNNGVQVLGITYEGIKATTLSGWFYNIENNVKIGYLDASYEGKSDTFTYSLTTQYVLQDYEDDTQSKIYGIGGSLGFKNSGLTLSVAYNKVDGKTAENFFGGGPYLTNAEHHTLSDAGKNGESILYGLEWDATSVGVEGLILSTHIDRHSNGIEEHTHEYDLVASYDIQDQLNITTVYSHIDDTAGAFNNLRLFINYSF
jgi:hypothetical protein